MKCKEEKIDGMVLDAKSLIETLEGMVKEEQRSGIKQEGVKDKLLELTDIAEKIAEHKIVSE